MLQRAAAVTRLHKGRQRGKKMAGKGSSRRCKKDCGEIGGTVATHEVVHP